MNILLQKSKRLTKTFINNLFFDKLVGYIKMQRVGGFRRKTRRKLSKGIRQKGKISIRRFFQKLDDGDRVYLVGEPAYQKGFYHPRFHGKAGIISGKQGTNYFVKIKDGNKMKKLIVHPLHLKKS